MKFLGSPVNPSDLNQIEGVYPIKPLSFPSVGGNEGVAQVVSVLEENGITSSGDVNPCVLKPGDLVIPAQAGFGIQISYQAISSRFYYLGTWREEAICHEADLYRLPTNKLSVEDAATIQVNPCTAYRMLHDFINIQGFNYF